MAARGELAGARAERQSALSKVRSTRVSLEKDLDSLEAESRRVQARLSGGGGPIRKGNGRFIIPTNGSFTSPFGSRWGRLHAGVDIAAPTGTPIRAADSRQRGDRGLHRRLRQLHLHPARREASPRATATSRASASRSGQSVRQGQVIGAVGNTGNSTGPHLHFEVRVGGSPVNPMGYL